MNRDAFEKLVSDWLDEPQSEALRARVEAVAAATPELRALRDEWERLERLLHCLPAVDARVNWPRASEHVLAAVAHDGAEITGVDAALRLLTPIDERVDWGRFGSRVRAAVAKAERGPRILRIYRRAALAGAGLAAAAALAFIFWWPRGAPIESTPAQPPIRVVGTSATPAVARISVVRESAPTANDVAADLSEAGAGASRETPEVFLMIEPPAVAARHAATEVFGF